MTNNYNVAAASGTGAAGDVVRIAGIGHLHGATQDPTRFSTWAPPSTWTGYDNYRPYIVPSSLTWSSDRINPADGSSDAGSMSVSLSDVDDNLTAALSYLRAGVPVTGTTGDYATRLTADVSRSATSLSVADSDGISTSTVYLLGQEAVYVSAKTATTLTVTRATYGTHASRHWAGDPILASPGRLRGLRVTVGRNFQTLTEADEETRWVGLLTSMGQDPGNDGLSWTITAESILMLLDRPCMRRPGRAVIGRADVLANRMNLAGLSYDVATDAFCDTQQNVYVASSIGQGFVAANKGGETAQPTRLVCYPGAAFGHSYTPRHMARIGEWQNAALELPSDATLWEVFPVDPTLANTRFGFYTAASGYSTFVPTSHPFLIALCWAMSITGDKTNRNTGVDSFDVLPEGQGAEIDEDLIDAQSFIDLAVRIPVSTPNLVYGFEGGSFSLRQHIDQELLGPYNVYVAQRKGKLTLLDISPRPLWDVTGVASITHDDIHEGWTPTVEPDLTESVSTVVAETGYSWMDGEFLSSVTAHLRELPSWVISGGRSAEFSLHGYAPGATDAVTGHIVAYLQRAEQPAPRITLPLTDVHEHQVEVGDTVRLTSSVVPDLSRGSVGITSYSMVVVEKMVAADRLVQIVLANINGLLRPASIAPALLITVVNANDDLDVEGNEFTVSGFHAEASTDAAWYAVGDPVQLVDGDSLLRIEGGRTIATVAAGNITLDAVFSATPDVGDLIVFDRYGAGATANQQLHGHFSADGRLSSGSDDAPYIYVG